MLLHRQEMFFYYSCLTLSNLHEYNLIDSRIARYYDVSSVFLFLQFMTDVTICHHEWNTSFEIQLLRTFIFLRTILVVSMLSYRLYLKYFLYVYYGINELECNVN